MWKRIASTALTLAAVFSSVACAGAGLPAPQEVVDGAIEALEDLSTYRFDLNTSLAVSGESNDNTFQMTVETSTSGASDTVNIQMRTEMTVSTDVPGQGQMGNEMSIELYLIDGVMYMRMAVPEEGESPWMKSEAPEQYPQTLTQIDSQRELLDTAQVTVVGSEQAGGVDCYVLEFIPDLARLWRWVVQQAGITDSHNVPAIPEESMAHVFRSVSVKQWVAKDSYLLVRAVTELSLELTPETMGAPEEEGTATMDITVDLLLRDHNRPVAIVLPAEADEAEEALFAFGFGVLAGATLVATVSTEIREPEMPAGTELRDVQMAVTTMMLENDLGKLPNPVTEPTNDMSAFPDTSTCGSDKMWDVQGNPFVQGEDGDGYILYGHDISGDGGNDAPVSYIDTRYTRGTYVVDEDGTVTQIDPGH